MYAAARSYLEIQQRIDLLNIRVEVLQDMLQLLKDQVTSSHSEWLEIIVIILILLEYVTRTHAPELCSASRPVRGCPSLTTVLVDLYFG